MVASSLYFEQCRAARTRPTLRVVVASLTSLALAALSNTFALPYSGYGRPGARDKLRTPYEIARAAPGEPKAENHEVLVARLPYTISLYAPSPTDGHHGLSHESREYMVEKVKAALHNTQNWVRSVEVRVTIDHHMHKIAKEHLVSEPPIETEDDVAYPYKAMKPGKRQLAPFVIECTVHLLGTSVVLSPTPKHAQATLTEAADHMYDILRRRMSKERARRIDQARRQKARAMEAPDVPYSYLPGQDDIDDEMMALEVEGEAEYDAEAERLYGLTGN